MTTTTHNFSLTLLRWFQENGRDLPWRQTRDPYAIWLSEVILQQTQVKQGWAYWERFMRRWPTVKQLAAATEDDVLLEWQGLGYYSRARHLHAAARQVVAMGEFPRTLEGIRSLKGVGDYTAAAIGSIAFDLPVAVVDGNVYRVLSRHFGITTPINTTEGRHEFSQLAQQLLPPKQASAYNQAIMDFGAIQCMPKAPRCADCPLQETCVALSQQRVNDLPVKLKTLTVQERRLTYVYVVCKGQTAIRRRGAGDIWQGLWEPWLVETVPEGAILLQQGWRHQLTHRLLLVDFYLLQTDERPSLPAGYVWVDESCLHQYAVPRLVELLLEKLPEIKKSE